MSESGFGEPVAEDTVVGGEGDSASPKAAFERSPLKVLASLQDQPFKQAVKAIEYIDAGRERERKFLKACSPAALNLIAQNGASYLTAVQGASA